MSVRGDLERLERQGAAAAAPAEITVTDASGHPIGGAEGLGAAARQGVAGFFFGRFATGARTASGGANTAA